MGGFGIDLGTANTVVCHARRGIVLDEPSVMAARVSGNGKRLIPVLVGREAQALIGRCPADLSIVRPLHDGVIIDLEAARGFILAVLSRINEHPWQRLRTRAVIGAPTGSTALERRALIEAAGEAGIRRVPLLPQAQPRSDRG